MSNKFWDSVLKNLNSLNETMEHIRNGTLPQKGDGMTLYALADYAHHTHLYGNAMDQRGARRDIGLEIVRRIVTRQTEIVTELKADILYTEGSKKDAAEFEPLDIPVVYLDEGLDRYIELVHRANSRKDSRSERRFHQEREKTWYERISRGVNGYKVPLLIAGAAHINNEFGFRDKLKEGEIELVVLNP